MKPSSPGPQELNRIARAATALPPIASAAIFVFEPDGQTLVLGGASGVEGEPLDRLATAVKHPDHPIARTARDGTSSFDVTPIAPGGPALRSHLVLSDPTGPNAAVIGVLAVAHDEHLDAATRAALEVLAAQAADGAAPRAEERSTWTDFEAAAPELARKGRELLYRTGAGEGLFITIRGNDLPRAHPVNAGVVDGHLYVFVQAKSAKRRDLEQDGRYALHAYLMPEAPHEFLLRGHAEVVDDMDIRQTVAKDWFFTVSDAYPLYELLISSALLGERATSDDWPPIYSSWTSGPL